MKPTLMKAPPNRATWRSSDVPTALLYLTPALLGFAVFYAWPLFRGVQISLTDWNLLSPAEWIGAANYQKLFTDPLFWNALKVTAIYVVVNIGSQMILGLGIAVLMQRLRIGTGTQSAILLPWLIPNVTVAIVTLFMLDPNVGFVNEVLDYIGASTHSFYGNSDLAIYTIALVNTWRNMGYTALLFYAGIQTISPDLYEAAALDGASGWRSFWSITLPMLRPITALILVVSMIGSFQIFDTVSVATDGGPGNATRVIYFYIYQKSFEELNMGYGAAMAVVLFALIFTFSLLQLRALRATESDVN
ncbi:MAG: sugar ABC transporter permease [Propionibacteriaceae bacterium]|jgi:multiple sugar transport system permease protein|nr:sugar ABC transporter permease [Propionibacteriaceae bacterium]